MTIISEQMPVYYRTGRLGVRRQNGSIVALLDIDILNTDGTHISSAGHTVTLTAQQIQQLATFVDNAESEFEAGEGAGLTKWGA